MQDLNAPLTIVGEFNPHFARVGGQPAIDRLVDAFYRHMDTLPQAAAIRAMHPANLDQARATLKLFLAEWMGGPRQFSQTRGQPRLRQRHLAFPIGEAERDAWLLCMRLALDEVVPDATLRDQLMRSFFKTAEAIRNDIGGSHEHHHHPTRTPSV